MACPTCDCVREFRQTNPPLLALISTHYVAPGLFTSIPMARHIFFTFYDFPLSLEVAS